MRREEMLDQLYRHRDSDFDRGTDEIQFGFFTHVVLQILKNPHRVGNKKAAQGRGGGAFAPNNHYCTIGQVHFQVSLN